MCFVCYNTNYTPPQVIILIQFKNYGTGTRQRMQLRCNTVVGDYINTIIILKFWFFQAFIE